MWPFKSNKRQVLVQLAERHLLPIGVAEFHEWSERIIAAAGLPAETDDQKYVLASMVLHDLKPTDHAMDDGFFVSKLRKIATNQVVHQMMTDIKAAKELRKSEKLAVVPAEAVSETK